MGIDKGSLVYPQSQLKDQRTRLFHMLSPFCDSVFISCRKEQAHLVQKGMACIFDYSEVEGPGVGLLSAFKVDQKSPWLVVACDMPFVSAEAVRFLYQSRDPLAHATVFQKKVNGERILEPLFAIWEVSALMFFENEFQNGNQSPRKALERLHCHILDSPDDCLLTSVDTQEEYLRFKG